MIVNEVAMSFFGDKAKEKLVFVPILAQIKDDMGKLKVMTF